MNITRIRCFRAGWWGAGDQPDCSIADKVSDGSCWAGVPGRWGEAQGEGEWAWTDRANRALQAVMAVTFP